MEKEKGNISRSPQLAYNKQREKERKNYTIIIIILCREAILEWKVPNSV